MTVFEKSKHAPAAPLHEQMRGPEKIEWQALEHDHKEHSQDWFWIVWIVAISVAIAAIIFNNFLFAALAIVSAFLMSVYASRPPEMIRYSVSHRGVSVNKTLYPFSSLESFAIREDEEEHDGRYLIVKSKKMFAPMLIISIDNMKSRDLRDFLLEELPEKDIHLPFSERIMELVGF